MTAGDLQGRHLALGEIVRLLGLGDAGSGFERDTEDQRIAVGDAAVHAAGVIRGGRHQAVAVVAAAAAFVVVLFAAVAAAFAFTMFVAAIFLKEPITWKKALGVALSFGGILWLILQSTFGGNGASETEPIGIMFCFANYIVFALYLGTCRNLIARYSVVTSMKWMFLISFLISIPFTLPHLPNTNFMAVPSYVWWEIAFMIIFSTFIAYYLIPVGQKRIRPTLVSMYGYLQPIIAIAVAIWTGMDRLTFTKLLAAILVFTGVWVVNQSRAAAPVKTEKE